ncbi:MAG TPA: DUF3788 domain-containing protein [Candidatus Blautia excrementipullorum]|nr:DUF3788 domain-containing protein [Candidatus Blautia excrementipullorum]
MIDLQDKGYCPSIKEIGEYINNPVFLQFCMHIKEQYGCSEKTEFSSCSWMPGWNIKFKKSGKNLCTLYPHEGFFTVLVVVGQKEKTIVEEILPECNSELREIYKQTKAGNGQKWLMLDLEDTDEMYRDTLRFIEIRRQVLLGFDTIYGKMTKLSKKNLQDFEKMGR